MANLSNINNKFLVTTGGDVGIGVTSPGEKLDVDGNIRVRGVSATKQGVIHNSGSYFSLVSTGDTSDTTGARIWLGNNSSANAYYQNASTHYFRDLSSSIKMTLLSSGNLGIGRTPDVKILDLQSTSGLALRFYNSATFKAGIEAVTTAGQMIGSSAVNDLAIRSQSDMLFSTGGNTERMRIDSSGNVGIGTDSPDTLLHVSNNSSNSQLTIERIGTAPGKYGFYTNTGNLFINNVTGGASTIPMVILNNGNVGIGAGNPSSKLAIDGGFDYPTVRWFSSNNTSRYMQVGMITPTEHSIRAYGSSSELTFWTANSFSMVIDGGGNVGIGTDSPDAKLHIDENTSNSYGTLRLEGSNRGGIIEMYNATYPVSKIQTDQSGNIGIYTSGAFAGSTLTEKLAITTLGNVAIGGTLGADSQFRVELKPSTYILAGLRIGYNATSNNYYDADTHHFRLGTGSSAGGNLIVGGGVFLGGTAAANQLDDYEEGTWTPAVQGSTTAGTATYGSQGGSYTKIGNKVTCWFSITNFAQSGAAGNFTITGLPFTCITTSAVRGCFSSNLRFYNMPFPGDLPVISLDDNNTSFIILWSRNNTTWIGQAVANTGNQYIEGYVTYSTA